MTQDLKYEQNQDVTQSGTMMRVDDSMQRGSRDAGYDTQLFQDQQILQELEKALAFYYSELVRMVILL